MALEQMSKADLLRVQERYEDEKDMLQRQRTKKISNSNYPLHRQHLVQPRRSLDGKPPYPGA